MYKSAPCLGYLVLATYEDFTFTTYILYISFNFRTNKSFLVDDSGHWSAICLVSLSNFVPASEIFLAALMTSINNNIISCIIPLSYLTIKLQLFTPKEFNLLSNFFVYPIHENGSTNLSYTIINKSRSINKIIFIYFFRRITATTLQTLAERPLIAPASNSIPETAKKSSIVVISSTASVNSRTCACHASLKTSILSSANLELNTRAHSSTSFSSPECAASIKTSNGTLVSRKL
ncbi:hypothetical protein AGLY_007598 [Aphis glycines]|uniref:Uncharacterized protein n=1 Tax=Aphis glycines TaxID=307491 RepID=A0A6G0TN11_APHGL|nr:hypothetical protein AGLY_007598 [Aphis glycines]